MAMHAAEKHRSPVVGPFRRNEVEEAPRSMLLPSLLPRPECPRGSDGLHERTKFAIDIREHQGFQDRHTSLPRVVQGWREQTVQTGIALQAPASIGAVKPRRAKRPPRSSVTGCVDIFGFHLFLFQAAAYTAEPAKL